jgi:hypothetical protein
MIVSVILNNLSISRAPEWELISDIILSILAATLCKSSLSRANVLASINSVSSFEKLSLSFVEVGRPLAA